MIRDKGSDERRTGECDEPSECWENTMNVDRRQLLLAGTAGIALLAASAIGMGHLAPLAASPVDSEELATPGPLGERALGDPDAPVTIVEYASLTCSHCAQFHKLTYPQLKEKYIDTGQVYFIFREFPLDPVATAAFMLTRCVPEEQYFPFVDALFANLDVWAYTNDRVAGLKQMGRQVGITEEKFEACLTNQELLDGVNWVKQRGAEQFDVNSTPTFFVNGEIHRGALPFEQFEKLIEPHLPS